MAGGVRECPGRGLGRNRCGGFVWPDHFGARPTAYQLKLPRSHRAGPDACEDRPARGPGSVGSLDGDALLDRAVDAEERPQRQPDGQRHDNRQQHGHNDLQVG